MKYYILIFFVALIISFVFCLIEILILKRIKVGQPILKYVGEHKQKAGTPTMGGLAFITAIVITTFGFVGTQNRDVDFALAVTSAFMLVGFIDDLIKIKRKDNEGLKPYQKILFQLSISIVIGIYTYINAQTPMAIPFTKTSLTVGFWCIPLTVFVFISMVNCVNLTDGLDGLVSWTSIAYLMGMAFFCFADQSPFFDVCLISIGALLAYLVFNSPKASVFMGDTGSLALGGLLGCVPVLTGEMLYIPIIGVMFVLSGISVILQVIYYKRTKKRIFLMAPLHHHFQHKGYLESKISYVYFIVTLVVSLICILFS